MAGVSQQEKQPGQEQEAECAMVHERHRSTHGRGADWNDDGKQTREAFVASCSAQQEYHHGRYCPIDLR